MLREAKELVCNRQADFAPAKAEDRVNLLVEVAAKDDASLQRARILAACAGDV